MPATGLGSGMMGKPHSAWVGAWVGAGHGVWVHCWVMWYDVVGGWENVVVYFKLLNYFACGHPCGPAAHVLGLNFKQLLLLV